MARRVFYSFHYVPDNWRAAKVRNVNTITDNENLVGNRWESVRKDSELAITRWINSQIKGTSCTIVLIGTNTASSRWVNYEIRHSWDKESRGIFGVRIHKILDQNNTPSSRGPNPFDNIQMRDGSLMSKWVKVYDPPQSTSIRALDHIRENIASWVEVAIASR
jgi:MTH538 TIR-like domain (DUF1863)